MPTFTLAFLVENTRDVDPPIQFAGVRLVPLEVQSKEARIRLDEELGPSRTKLLAQNGGRLPVFLVQLEAADEEAALAAGYRQAKTTVEAYSLIEPQLEGIDFSRRRPLALPNALLVDAESTPATMDFRYHGGSMLGRFTVGEEVVSTVRAFNDRIVRRLAQLYPESLINAGMHRSPLEARIARAVHWYSQAEGQADETLAFVCYWIGLEAITLKSSKSSSKEKTIAHRLDRLAKYHDHTSDWAENIRDLWDRRSDVVHEGFGASAEGSIPDIGAAEINEVKYLFIIALLYALECRATGVTMDELWNPRNLDHYTPSVALKGEEMPVLLQVINQQRRLQRWDGQQFV